MTTRRTSIGRRTLAMLVGVTLGSCNGPIVDPDRRDREGDVASVFVTITTGDRGSPAMPRPYAATSVTYTVRIEARRSDGSPVSGRPWVSVNVSPGALESLEGPDVRGRNVQLTNGVVDGLRLTFSRSYGETRIAAEESGYVPAALEAMPQCANGRDDDGDGRTDFPADYGCAAANDDSERGGSYALGTSEPIFFASPRIADVQGSGTTSALVNERVSISAGTLVVTRISVDGFWVTDTADTSCGGMPCNNSLFAFNFRLPEGLRPCDRLSLLQGSVQEFVSTTQLGQPAWAVAPDGLWVDRATSGACPIPAAVEITPMTADAISLERIENSVVRVRDVTLSPNIGPDRPMCTVGSMGLATCNFAPGRSNCDADGDNRIDFTNPPESQCANACQVAVGCSEWTGWTRFGQLAVDMPMAAATGVRIVISPRDADSNFNPIQPAGATARHGVAITGTLKQVGPNWIIEPRCIDDLVLQGDGQMVRDANDSCTQPRSVTEEP